MSFCLFILPHVFHQDLPSRERIMAKDDKRIVEEVDGVARESNDARPDFSQPPARKQLPKEIHTKLKDE